MCYVFTATSNSIVVVPNNNCLTMGPEWQSSSCTTSTYNTNTATFSSRTASLDETATEMMIHRRGSLLVHPIHRIHYWLEEPRRWNIPYRNHPTNHQHNNKNACSRSQNQNHNDRGRSDYGKWRINRNNYYHPSNGSAIVWSIVNSPGPF